MSIVCPQCNTTVPDSAIQNTQATCAECGYVFSVAKLRRNPRRGKAPLLGFLSTTPYIHTRVAGDTLILTRTRVSWKEGVTLIVLGYAFLIGIDWFSGLNPEIKWSAPALLLALAIGTPLGCYLLFLLTNLFTTTTMRVNRSTITVQHNFLPERDLTFPSALAIDVEVEENNHELFDIVVRLHSGKYALLLKNLPDVTQAETIRQQIENHLDRLDISHLEDNAVDETSPFQFGKRDKQKQISKG